MSGFVGLTVKRSGLGVRVATSSIASAKRLLRGWLPAAGTTILSVGGLPVRSQEDLDRAFSRVPIEGWVEIVTPDWRYSVQVQAPRAAATTKRSALATVGGASDEDE